MPIIPSRKHFREVQGDARADHIGTVVNFVRKTGSTSADKPFAADDGELRHVSPSTPGAAFSLSSDDGERVPGTRKQLADPGKNHPVCGSERRSDWFTPAQHNDLLPKYDDSRFQRRSRPEQVNDKTKYQSSEIQHSAQRRPIRYATPTGFNLR